MRVCLRYLDWLTPFFSRLWRSINIAVIMKRFHLAETKLKIQHVLFWKSCPIFYVGCQEGIITPELSKSLQCTFDLCYFRLRRIEKDLFFSWKFRKQISNILVWIFLSGGNFSGYFLVLLVCSGWTLWVV